MEGGEWTRAHQEQEAGQRMCDQAGIMSQGTTQRCRECEGRETLLTKLNAVDWTADELHLNGWYNTPTHGASLTCTFSFGCHLTAAAVSDAWNVMRQRSRPPLGGMIRAIAWHDTVGLSCRFGASQKPHDKLARLAPPRVLHGRADSFGATHPRIRKMCMHVHACLPALRAHSDMCGPAPRCA
jgi:hypothetical protein